MTTYIVEPANAHGIKRVWIVIHEDGILGDGAALVRPGDVFHGVPYAALMPGEWTGTTDPITWVGP